MTKDRGIKSLYYIQKRRGMIAVQRNYLLTFPHHARLSSLSRAFLDSRDEMDNSYPPAECILKDPSSAISPLPMHASRSDGDGEEEEDRQSFFSSTADDTPTRTSSSLGDSHPPAVLVAYGVLKG